MSISENMCLVFFSFGYKYGYPLENNFLVDVRCLPNPYWEEELRAHSGLTAEVASYVLDSKAGQEMKIRLEEFLSFWFEQQADAGKETLRIAIGCTGGRHRSVAFVESLVATFSKQGYTIEHFHRDITKDER